MKGKHSQCTQKNRTQSGRVELREMLSEGGGGYGRDGDSIAFFSSLNSLPIKTTLVKLGVRSRCRNWFRLMIAPTHPFTQSVINIMNVLYHRIVTASRRPFDPSCLCWPSEGAMLHCAPLLILPTRQAHFKWLGQRRSLKELTSDNDR